MKLRTLGGLELLGADFTQPKPLVLLSYLCLEGPQTRPHLAELFWPEGERRKSLSMALTRLRQAAGSVVETDAGRVWTPLANDAGALLEALGRSDWQMVEALYRGAFLEGVVLDWREELEAWVYTTREFLAERVQHALLGGAEDAARDRDFSEAQRLAERAYRLPGAPPTETGALERLYRLLVACGSVLAPKVRKELAEYGLTTTLSTETAQAALSPDLPSSAPSQTLPLRATSFVGRDVELIELSSVLEQPGCRLLTLLGSAGIGKTRLALQFAQEQQRTNLYPDGVYFIALETEDASTLLPFVAQALGCTLTAESRAAEELGAFLEAKRALVVLDNFEHLSEAALLLRTLLMRAPALKLLVTSRVRLGLEEEYLFTLSGLGFPQHAVPPPDAAAFGAVQLFGQRARQLHQDFDLAHELPGVLELCAFLDGSPLGLELAAGWVRFMACADIVRELRRDLDFLTSQSRVPERHRSLRAAFDYSWRLLSAREQETLAALSVFQGGFTREAASEVVGATIPTLVSLLDKSLLRLSLGSRFEQHPLIAHYAAERLRSKPEQWRSARADHAAYFMRLALEQDAAVQAGRQGDALRVLEAEWANVRACFEHSLERHDLTELGRSLELLEMLHDTRGSYTEALAFLARAETILSAHDPGAQDPGIQNLSTQDPSAPEVLGGVRAKRAWFELRLGRYDHARASALSALELLTQTSLGRVSVLNTLSILERRTGAYLRAREACEKGLLLARRHHGELVVAKMLASLADVEEALGNPAASERHFLEAIALYRKHNRVLGVVRNLNNLGWLYYVGNRLDEAKPVFEEGLRLAHEIDYR